MLGDFDNRPHLNANGYNGKEKINVYKPVQK